MGLVEGIRYNDPDPHIRLRFLLTRNSNLSQVIETLHDSFEELQSQNLIWKIQTETYIRELERYGPSNYELTESIFEAYSDLILNYLSLKNLFETENTSLFFSFMAIDSLLNSFNLTLKDKVYLLESMQHSFKKEFECDKVLKKELDKNFRLLSNEMYLILNANDNGYQPLAEIIEFKELQIKSTVRSILTNLEVSMFSYLSSQIHMTVNRQYTSKQRQYELLIYDHMHRFYKSQYFKINA